MKLLSVSTFFVEEMQNHQFDCNFRKLREILLARPRKLYLLKKKPQILRSFYDLPHIDNNSIGEVVPLITNRSINPIDIRMRRRASHPMANSIQQSAFVSPLYKENSGWHAFPQSLLLSRDRCYWKFHLNPFSRRLFRKLKIHWLLIIIDGECSIFIRLLHPAPNISLWWGNNRQMRLSRESMEM